MPMDSSPDESLFEVNPDGEEWVTADASLFAQPDRPYPTTEDPFFASTGGDPDAAVLSADIFSSCVDGNQPPSRIRARSELCPNEIDSTGLGTAVSAPSVPGAASEQDDGTKKKWCPEDIYQGLLNIPVCSQFDDISILSSDLVDYNTGKPLTATGLKIIVTATLSKSGLLL